MWLNDFRRLIPWPRRRKGSWCSRHWEKARLGLMLNRIFLFEDKSQWCRHKLFPWAWEAEEGEGGGARGESALMDVLVSSFQWVDSTRSCNCEIVLFARLLRKCWMRMEIWFAILEIHPRIYCLASSRANALFTFMKALLVIQVTVIGCASSILSMLWSVWLHFYPFHTFDCRVFVFYFSLHLFRNFHPGLGRSFSPWYIGRSGIPFNLSQVN